MVRQQRGGGGVSQATKEKELFKNFFFIVLPIDSSHGNNRYFNEDLKTKYQKQIKSNYVVGCSRSFFNRGVAILGKKLALLVQKVLARKKLPRSVFD